MTTRCARPLLLLFVLLGVWLPTAVGAQAPSDEDPRQFEMVLIHGLGGSNHVWDDCAPFMNATFKVYMFELGGHGDTQPILNPSISGEVERLHQFLAENDITYPTLVGHGLGGMVALEYTLDNPAKVHRLIVIDSAPRQMADAAQKKAIAQELLDDYDSFVANKYLVMGPDPDITEEVVDMALRTDSATFISLLLNSFDYDMTPRLHTLTVPMLVVGSELLFPSADDSQNILHQIGFAHAPSLSFKRMGLTGHYVMMERPAYTASVLMAFGVTADYEFEH